MLAVPPDRTIKKVVAAAAEQLTTESDGRNEPMAAAANPYNPKSS
jgi:hypothetical protein